MKNIKRKKLMILGGARYIIPIINRAHKMNIFVITCDYLPENIAHKYSDQYCNISIIDKEAVLKKAKELRIDGIMSFACDPGVVTAAYVADKMGLPSCGPYESVCILQNKGLFRKFLEDNGFNVPIAKSYKSIENAIKDVDMFNWPVIVKPTDSAGSKGVTKVIDKDKLEESIKLALSFSHSNEFIIEDFLEKKGHSSDCDSFCVDGELKFVSFSSQRFDDKCENPYTPAVYSWPSSISKDNQEYLTSEIQRLLSLLNMKTSIFNIETRECVNGKSYIMECSPRGGGNRLAEMMQYATGIDFIGNTIKAALGLELGNITQKEPHKGLLELILHSNKPGIFKELWLDDKIKDNIVERELWIESGTEVGGFSGANEAIGTLVLKFANEKEMESFLEKQDDYVKVILK